MGEAEIIFSAPWHSTTMERRGGGQPPGQNVAQLQPQRALPGHGLEVAPLGRQVPVCHAAVGRRAALANPLSGRQGGVLLFVPKKKCVCCPPNDLPRGIPPAIRNEARNQDLKDFNGVAGGCYQLQTRTSPEQSPPPDSAHLTSCPPTSSTIPCSKSFKTTRGNWNTQTPCWENPHHAKGPWGWGWVHARDPVKVLGRERQPGPIGARAAPSVEGPGLKGLPDAAHERQLDVGLVALRPAVAVALLVKHAEGGLDLRPAEEAPQRLGALGPQGAGGGIPTAMPPCGSKHLVIDLPNFAGRISRVIEELRNCMDLWQVCEQTHTLAITTGNNPKNIFKPFPFLFAQLHKLSPLSSPFLTCAIAQKNV